MRIGINCLGLSEKYYGGVTTYVLGIVGGFINTVREDEEIIIFVTKKNTHYFSIYSNNPSVKILSPCKTNRNWAGFIRWGILYAISCIFHSKNLFKLVSNISYIRKRKYMEDFSDVIYIPTTTLDCFSYKKPTILSMHDIQQYHYPEFFSYKELSYRNMSFPLSIEHSSFLQASSLFMKSDFCKHFPKLNPDNVFIAHEGVFVEEFKNNRNINVFEKYKLPKEFVFMPAQLWKHKNHITVLKALLCLKNKGMDIHIVLTGAKYSASEEIFSFIKDNDMESIVHYLGKVPFDDLVALYQNAKFFITAVLYESSSLPLIEAAAAGTALIASNTPPNKEMSEHLCINLFETTNDNELSSLLESIYNDIDYRKGQVESNTSNIGYYTWDNSAEQFRLFMYEHLKKS